MLPPLPAGPSGRLLADVPVTPGADEARRWALRELSKKVYQDARPGLGQTVWDWIVNTFTAFLAGLKSLGSNTGVLILLGIAVLVVVAAVVVIRPRLNRRATNPEAVFDADTTLTAAAHRALAAAAARDGDLATAVMERFRGMVRAGEERDVVPAAPGRTAEEVASALGRAFPGHATQLRRAAGTFNTVRYGHGQATQAMADDLEATDAAVAAATPVHADSVTDGARA
jgi:hypothetical protein